MSFKSIENWQGLETGPSESGPRRVKRGHLGSKRVILGLLRGSLFKGSQKGALKRPIGAKTCSVRPISCKKGVQKGVILRVYEANLARLTEPKGLYWRKGVQDDYFTPI